MSDSHSRILKCIAVRLKWSMADVRSFVDDLEGDGIQMAYVPWSGELCTACGYHNATETGFCIGCNTKREVENRKERDEEERERLERRAEKAINANKTERKRMRKKFLANPRDKKAKELWAEIEEFLDTIESNYRQATETTYDPDEEEQVQE